MPSQIFPQELTKLSLEIMPHTHESRIAEMIEIVKEMKKRGIPVPDMGDKKKADAKPAAKKKVKEAGDTSGLKKVGSLKNAKTALNEDV